VVSIKSPWLKVAALEMVWYMRNQLLRDSDWAGMANSVEIRLPLVDIDVFRRLSPMIAANHENGKLLLGKLPARKLPDEVVNRPKTGFAVPIHQWMAGLEPQLTQGTLSRGLRHWATYLMREFKLVA
jgi:asparagine synthase (glutamine-hydrolysing)